MGQRLVALVAAVGVAAVLSASAPGAGKSLPDWAGPQIATVVKHGMMAPSVRAFHPNAPLTRQALATLAFDLHEALTPTPPPPPPPPPTTSTETTTTGPATTTGETTTGETTTTTPTTTTMPKPPKVAHGSAPVTMAALDQKLVISLGLLHSAKQFAAGAREAGIPVPGRFGTEAVARLLGLRINHPASEDYLELRPQDIATRAEAAYSAAQILGFGWLPDSWQIGEVKNLADSFALPNMTIWQKRILRVAFSKIGMPYIWGGTSDGAEAPFGVHSRGGYDCSGFVWRVYKLQRYPNEGRLASVIRGRTTYSMSVEVPRSKRISFAKLRPADVIFFGSRGPRSTGPEIDHTAIYVGNGWFIQSSGYGVALATLDGWYRDEFAWGRRPLREAGLEG